MGEAFAPRVAFRTDAGRVRANNEDLPLVDRERGVFGVIDGVGGHAAGEMAAAIARDVILQRLSRPLGTPAERVREAIALANNEIFRRASESPDLAGMTCVVTLALLNDGLLTIGHVGDSRLYKLDASGIRKLTRDHSPVGEREDAREITEAEAMRHPRRHEVFRDVGGALRDKDEADYVDVMQEPMSEDSAILLCTDGLTDMVPAAAIDAIVRRRAGNPGAVATALVEAANDAGGRDNVTVVYAEGPAFADAVRPARGELRGGAAAPPRHGGPVAQTLHWIVGSRATWFALGALTGVLAVLLLLWRVPAATSAFGSRTLVVGQTEGAYPLISLALDAARAGDVVRIEPGLYPERLEVPDGVRVEARVPGTVRLARAAGHEGPWVAVTAFGELNAEISGLRIESTDELPIDVGFRIFGTRTMRLVELDGPMRTGIELRPAAALTLHGSHFTVAGTALVAGEDSEAVLTKNVFLKQSENPGPPVSASAQADLVLRGNLFAGFGPEIVTGITAKEKQQIAAENVIVSAGEKNKEGRMKKVE